MLTDWLLIRRAALEIEQRLAGSRVRDVAKLPDGRIAIALWARGTTQTLCIDVWAPTPLVELEPEMEFPIAVDPGFVRAIGAALRGMTLAGARVRKGDRLMRLDFATRSRFGVAGGASLLLELVPRFGNAILLKDETIVHALREFSLAENGTRSIHVGARYQPPSLEGRSIVPRAIADSYPADDAMAIVDDLERRTSLEPLFVYRKPDGALVQAHLVPLARFAEYLGTREPSLLAVFAEMAGATSAGAANQTVERRRAALCKLLTATKKKVDVELRAIDAKRAQAAGRERLREDGEAIYATLHERDGGDRDSEKERASKIFARYKKLGASIPHLAQREAHLRTNLDSIQALLWEIDRCAPGDIGEVGEAISALVRPRAAPTNKPAGKPKRRAPLQWRSPSGSRILVGRTPQENADLTFRIARPDDRWFHVQGQPGAHAILARDDKQPPPDVDLQVAAALAALHSKAKTSPNVAVDWTLRKHVRKRPASAPGLVFYTNPTTLFVTPSEPPPDYVKV
ncbi:MAG TPA: NFACT RNA binding domain-containing protein [Candidatus Baltobacteraceae bacterium]